MRIMEKRDLLFNLKFKECNIFWGILNLFINILSHEMMLNELFKLKCKEWKGNILVD
jgi:hypothetical protein